MTALLARPDMATVPLGLADLDALIAANVAEITANLNARREPTRFAIYARISSDPDGTEEGVDEQEKDLRAFIARHYPDAVVVEDAVYKDDDRSAFKETVVRDEFEAMMRDASLGVFDAVAVRDSDRLYRRLDELSRITRELASKVQIVARMEGEVDLTTAAGILRAQMLGAVAEHESRRKAERIRDNARHRAQGGTMTTVRRPFGWAWRSPCDGVPITEGGGCEHKKPHPAGERPRQGTRGGVVPHPVEGPALAQGYEWARDGVSLKEIARRWDAGHFETGTEVWDIRDVAPDGLRGSGGGRFTDSSHVRRNLRAPRNAGLVAHHGRLVAKDKDGTVIVDPTLWQQVQNVLDGNRAKAPVGRPGKAPLSSIARCGLCAEREPGEYRPMTAANRPKPNRPTVPIYECNKRRHLQVPRAEVDGYVLGTLGDFLVIYADDLRDAAAGDDVGAAERLARQEVVRLDDQINAYKQLGAEFDPTDLAAILTDLRTKKAEAERRAASRSRRPSVAALLAADDVAAEWRALVEAEDKEPLRNVLRDMVDTVIVHRRPTKESPVDEQVTIKLQEWARAEG